MIKNVLFDMDDVILDDEYSFMERIVDLLSSYNINITIKESTEYIGISKDLLYQKRSEIRGSYRNYRSNYGNSAD